MKIRTSKNKKSKLVPLSVIRQAISNKLKNKLDNLHDEMAEVLNNVSDLKFMDRIELQILAINEFNPRDTIKLFKNKFISKNING